MNIIKIEDPFILPKKVERIETKWISIKSNDQERNDKNSQTR